MFEPSTWQYRAPVRAGTARISPACSRRQVGSMNHHIAGPCSAIYLTREHLLPPGRDFARVTGQSDSWRTGRALSLIPPSTETWRRANLAVLVSVAHS